jgi:endoribonuclease Dicer
MKEEEMKSSLNLRETPDDMDENRIDPKHIYKIKSTGACATIYNSIGILYQYCNSLPRDKYYEPVPDFLIAEGPNGFACEIQMPRNILSECNRIRGPICSSSISAKREAAFRMIKLLHAMKELDDDLRAAKLYERDALTGAIKRKSQVVPVGVKREIRNYSLKVPYPFQGDWVDGVNVCLSLLKLSTDNAQDKFDRFLSVGILSFKKLSQTASNFNININDTLHSVQTFSIKKKLLLDSNMLSLIRKFHYEFFRSILRSEFTEENDWACLCVPLKVDKDEGDTVTLGENSGPLDLIDMEALEFCTSCDPKNIDFLKDPDLDWKDVKDIILFDKYRYSRNYILLELRKDLTPLSPIESAKSKFPDVKTVYQIRLNCEQPIDPDQILIRAIPIGYPYLPRKKFVDFMEVMLIPQFSNVCRIKRYHIVEAKLFPVIMVQLTHRLMIYDILKNRPFPKSSIKLDTSLDRLQKAFTTPAAALHFNYERQEFMGDSFLKVHSTIHLFVKSPLRHEGYLTQSRIELENNKNLQQCANNMNIEGFILGYPLSRQNWYPPTLQSNQEQKLSDKQVADVVEAAIGACFLETGVSGASFAVKFFLGNEFLDSWEDYAKKWNSYDKKYSEIEPALLESCRKVEEKIPYKFKNIHLMAEALTHPSAITGAGSYERLEFLGDSVLGFLVSRYIYKLKYKLKPGPLSDLRSELVNNQFLATCAVTLNLQHYLNHMNEDLAEAISSWTKSCLSLQEVTEQKIKNLSDDDDDLDSETYLFWNQMYSAPKAIGDIVESVLGAIFLDSGFDPEEVDKVLHAILITPWWYRFDALLKSDDGLQSKHPLRELSDLISSLKCGKLVLEVEVLSNGLNRCRLILHGNIIGENSSESKRDSKKQAAFGAVQYFQKNQKKIKEFCDCNQKEESVQDSKEASSDEEPEPTTEAPNVVESETVKGDAISQTQISEDSKDASKPQVHKPFYSNKPDRKWG